ncbi:hypothetical protein CCP4SC76_500001 [Gammaproteobacteria bacterium]
MKFAITTGEVTNMQISIENYKTESAILHLEKKELRLQRRLYALLLVTI